MKYRLAGGNVAVADYDVCSEVLQKNGLTVSEAIRNLFAYIACTHEVPKSVQEGASQTTAGRMQAFEELNALIEGAPRVPWHEGEDRAALRDALEERYV